MPVWMIDQTGGNTSKFSVKKRGEGVGDKVSVGIMVGVTEAGLGGARIVAVGVDSGARVVVADWQAVIRARIPIKSIFFIGVPF